MTPQQLELLHRLHPDFAQSVDDNGLWRGAYPVALVGAQDFDPYRVQDRRGKDDRGDSRATIDDIADQLRNGSGLRSPIVLEHSLRSGTTYIDEGHHRVEAAKSAGGILLPTVAQVTEYGSSRGHRVGKIPSLQPNAHGWYPKVADPNLVMKGR